mmetsp:Transcript_25039/g.73295  ORF Transcript_25039/g.73295 Transcript_25039/m.73295 type:complete len:156 (-) Transcript_25039:3486-3953(-)
MVGDNFDACPTDGSANEQSCPPGEASYFTAMSGVLDALPALAMAYACQISTPTLWNEMYQPTRGRMLLLYLYALGGAMTLYLLVGGFGYSTFGSRVLSNLLSSYPASPIINAARIGLSFVTIVDPSHGLVFHKDFGRQPSKRRRRQPTRSNVKAS